MDDLHRDLDDSALRVNAELSGELNGCMAVMYMTFEELTVALRQSDRWAVHAAAHCFANAWSKARVLLGKLVVPNEDARNAVRAARRALRAAAEVVDLLFAAALVTAVGPEQQFLHKARTKVMGAMELDCSDAADRDLD